MSVTTIDMQPRLARVHCEAQVAASPNEVYELFLNEPQNWFYNNEETREKTPTRCEGVIGGKFYFELPNGGFNTIGQITMLKPGYKIRMRGDCTMPQAVLMNMTFAFEESDGGTHVSLELHMMGEFGEDVPPMFEKGWQDGIDKLKALSESK